MELSDRLVALLGKRETDPDFQEFFKEFKPYLQMRSAKGIKDYDFDKLGFSILYIERLGGVIGVTFHSSTRSVRDGYFKPYEGLLPYGITTSDTRDEVRLKLCADPARSTPYEGHPNQVPNPWEQHSTWWDTYDAPMKIGVIFRSPLSDIGLFSVHYDVPQEDYANMQRDMIAAKHQQSSNQLSKNHPRRKSTRRAHRQPKKDEGES